MAAADNSPQRIELAPAGIPQTPHVGDTVGNYRLVKEVATGGMGSVFIAEHASIGRRVAVKFLLAELCPFPDIVGRFFDEARAVNRISHENIIEIFDFVREPNGLSYLVMELLEGTDLYQTRVEDGPYPIERLLAISEQVATALFAAHQVGVIHRDLKPENVFLTQKRGSRDFAKLLDFGLAKLSEEIPVAHLPTQAGVVLGTPGYMSPEQALGAKVDVRSDVFSLGALIHWMIADEVPQADGEPVATSVAGQTVPPKLVELIRRSIRMQREERPASMAEVALNLAQLRRDLVPAEVGRASRSKPPLPTGLSRRDLEAAEPTQKATQQVEAAFRAAAIMGTEPLVERKGTSSLLLVGVALGSAFLSLALVAAMHLFSSSSGTDAQPTAPTAPPAVPSALEPLKPPPALPPGHRQQPLEP